MDLVTNTPSSIQEGFKASCIQAIRFLLTIITICLIFYVSAYASQADEFSGATQKLYSWVRGNLGKTIIMGGLIFSLAAFAWTRDFKLLFLPLIASVVIGVIVGIINAAFTAVI